MSNLSDMENELNDHKKRNLEWEHRFESEVSVLRSNIRQTEAKFQEVAATPPKVSNLTKFYFSKGMLGKDAFVA